MIEIKKPLISRIVGNGFKPFPTLIAIVFIFVPRQTLPVNETGSGFAQANPAIKEATAIKPWSFTETGYSASGPSKLRPALQFSETGREVIQGEKKVYNTIAYALSGGATLLTRLDSITIPDFFRGYHRVRKSEDGLSVEISIIDFEYVDTSLKEVEKTLSVSILEHIRKLDSERKTSMQPDRTITIVDWGCGDGTALLELSGQLKQDGISNVRLVGFSDRAYENWNIAGHNVTFILDISEGLPLYFKEQQIDFVYSHFGLYYTADTHFGHFSELRSILSPKSEIISNFSNETVEILRITSARLGLELQVLDKNDSNSACRLVKSTNDSGIKASRSCL